MTDRYCVIGNPVAHSRSPAIHARFAAQCHQDLSYEAILVPLDGFAAAVGDFAAAGGKGANVTLPFKEEAFGLCSRRSARAERAGAVNTLAFGRTEIFGDNTDGAGLVRDIEVNL
ncbi:MAG: shikimate dehydrogenase, partial [Candidatus Dechloromonas phosphoritropha]